MYGSVVCNCVASSSYKEEKDLCFFIVMYGYWLCLLIDEPMNKVFVGDKVDGLCFLCHMLAEISLHLFPQTPPSSSTRLTWLLLLLVFFLLEFFRFASYIGRHGMNPSCSC
ncbi:hypothetical protein L6452_33312 [Arctium lappa]|uniref:Uncharacterized protein n=1 Tax=Arctium lappa TaxID=4217 RepID=A0ACB8Z7D6_ARCLA|nr:hypothetical protein L6452_33312 [Arctium lappa]